MEYRFCLDEVVAMLQDAIREGYHYGSIEVVEPDDENAQSGEGADLWLRVDDYGGEDGVEYEPVESVPLGEVRLYGNKGQGPAPGRLCCKVD